MEGCKVRIEARVKKERCIVKLLAREGRRRSTHGGESGWIPWRVAAAGVEEGDLLGALPVARRALGEV